MSFNDLLDLILTSLTIIACCSIPPFRTRRANYTTNPTMTGTAAFVTLGWKNESFALWLLNTDDQNAYIRWINEKFIHIYDILMNWTIITMKLNFHCFNMVKYFCHLHTCYIMSACSIFMFTCYLFFVKMQHKYVVDMQHNLRRILAQLPHMLT